MKQYILPIFFYIVALTGCANAQLADIIRELHDPASTKVLVVAHRADWRNAPENSIAAMRCAIAMGVDIIETDVRRTKDGILVLIHDETLDRSTTGKGRVSDHTWAELQDLNLRDGLGSPTAHKIPTLEEGLLTIKGRVMINLDKCYPYFAQAMALLEKTGTVEQAIFKTDLPVQIVKAENGRYLDHVAFMPVISFDLPGSEKILQDYMQEMHPVAFELIFSQERPAVDQALVEIKQHGARVWVDTLWPHMCAGHDDERALSEPNATYGWLVVRGVTIMQTDRPAFLLNYLANRSLKKPGSQN